MRLPRVPSATRLPRRPRADPPGVATPRAAPPPAAPALPAWLAAAHVAALPLALAALTAVALPGCFRDCPPVDDATLALLPATLSETGLYADIATGTVADDVIAYIPRFALWSDGAEKQRWIRLPGAIDAADPDAWTFPEGTRAWKAFTRDGVRVETRMIEKIGPDEWAAVAYRWDGADAVAAPDGAADAGGTAHDIPTAEDCVACHGGRASYVLGFSAVQLAGAEGYDLDRLVADGLVGPAPGAISTPTPLDAAALGYLHANCSHCHNADRDDVGCYDPDVDLDFTLPARALASVDDAPAVQTARSRFSPGDPDDGEILARMSARAPVSAFPTTMPPLATEEVDDEALTTIREWAAGL